MARYQTNIQIGIGTPEPRNFRFLARSIFETIACCRVFAGAVTRWSSGNCTARS